MTDSSIVTLSEAEKLDRATIICWEAWGLSGAFKVLPSERDHIFSVDASNGVRYLLKISGPGEAELVADFQTQAILHLARIIPALPVPQLVLDREGRYSFRTDWPGTQAPIVRLYRWLDGVVMADSPNSHSQVASLGALQAHLLLALADFEHPGADYYSCWDIKNTADLLPRLSVIHDTSRRALVEAAIDKFITGTKPALNHLRCQVIHADLTPFNVLVDRFDNQKVNGIIDFGDIVRSPLVCDVAIAASYFIGKGGDNPMALPAALVSAFHAVIPLSPEEIMLIAPLMEARHATTVAISEDSAARDSKNRAHLTKNTNTAWRGLEILSHESMEHWARTFLLSCELES